MSATAPVFLKAETIVNAPIDRVWECFTLPAHVVCWYNASEDWHAPKAENDLQPGGKFTIRMEAKDGSFGFDFGGVYDAVEENKIIEYTLGDNRKVKIEFIAEGAQTTIAGQFEPEDTNPHDVQQGGWQAILDNFKKYVELQ
jgi:uncharacterized protein YndB with AHSA1/START domain